MRVPRFLQFNVDGYSVVKEFAKSKGIPYMDYPEAKDITLNVIDGSRQIGVILWVSGTNTIAGYPTGAYIEAAARKLAEEYGFREMEPMPGLKELAFPLEGLKTEDFSKALASVGDLYEALRKYPGICEGLKAAK